MEALIALAVMLVLAVPFASIAAFVMGIAVRGRVDAIGARLAALEATIGDHTAVARLERRLSALEAAGLRSAAAAPEAPVSQAAAPPAEAPDGDDVAARPPPSAPAPPSPVPAWVPPPPAPPGREVELQKIDLQKINLQKIDLEEQFGTRGVVWLGGLALALGGIFLVRYSIEQDLIGPGVRITLGALLGAALTGGGEWLRRRENPAGGAGQPAAHIPGILTAAGTTVCYATVFAAYALYGFIDPPTAFVLLGVVALATLGAALLHGPALAALGLVGAEVSPMLAATETPNHWALYVYIAVVTAAAFALARLRLWRWLAVTALAFGVIWTVPGIPAAAFHPAPLVFHAAAGFVLAALLIVAGLFLGPEAPPGRVDALSSAALTAYLFLAAWIAAAVKFDTAGLVPFALLIAATAAIAWRSAAAAAALPSGALLATLVMLAWSLLPELSHLIAPGPGPDPSQASLAQHFVFGAWFAGLFGTVGYLAQGRYTTAAVPLIWSSTAVVTPLAILIALYARIRGSEPSLLFAAIAVALAAWCATAAERLVRREPRPGVPAAAALYAAGSAAAVALALTFSLEKGWLTVGLALMAPAVAWVAGKRPLPLLRWVAAAAAILTVARIAWEPRIVGDDLGTTPFFNWLLYGYGVPALAFWTGGFLLRRRADDGPSRMLEAAAILFTVLFAALQIRHAMTGGDIYAAAYGSLEETAMNLCAGLAIAIGLEWLRQRTGNVIHNAGALIVAALTLVAVFAELVGTDNPRISGLPVGGVFLNLILLGYGLPAVLAITLALIARRTRPMACRMTAVAVSMVLALAYMTLEIMRICHGPALTGPISDAESYTFSTVWLAFGVILLFIALPLDSKPVRLASAAIVGLATAKVFIFDLQNLGGFWRALSFIGLGLVLVGIGYLYQRLLFPTQRAAGPP